MKLSIIIPVYNAGKYIEKCLESIKKQCLLGFELIIINDGSTDNSLSIINKFKDDNKELNIEVISVENGGVSRARNIGIDNAKSEYITFIDADDYIDDNTYKYMFNLNDNYDILGFSYSLEFPSHSCEVLYPFFSDLSVLDKKGIRDSIITRILPVERKNKNIGALVFRFIIKKEIIQNIRFNKHIKIQEDVLFCIEAFLNAKSCLLVNQPFYHYVQNGASATNKYQTNLMHQFVELNDLIKNILIMNECYECNIKKLVARDVMCVTISISNCFRKDTIKDQLNEEYKSILNFCSTISIKNILYNPYCNNGRKLTMILLKLRLTDLVKVMYKIKEYKRRKKLHE